MAAQHHHHHDFAGAPLVGAARDALMAAGEQWTQMRADVFEALAAVEKPASAYDIAESVGARRGKRVAANSVYRILDLFVLNNIAMRVESANAYIANAHPGCQHDCIFLVCRNCKTATHVDDDKVTGDVRNVAVHEGFTPERPVIEILGTCAKCAA